MIPIILWALVALIGGVQGRCSITPLVDDERSIAYACIHGDLQDLNDLPDNTEWIEFSVSRFSSIPDDAFWKFRNLRRLAFYNCHINSISSYSFRGLDNLEWLIFHGTKLTVARALWFQNTSRITRLIMDRCNLVHIEPEVFNMLPRLQILGIRDNDLDCLPIDGLAGLLHLRTVRIDGNPWLCECRARLERLFRERRITQEEECRVCSMLPVNSQCMTHIEIPFNHPPVFTEEDIQIFGNNQHFQGEKFQTSVITSLDRLPESTTWIQISGVQVQRLTRYMFFRFGNSLRSLELRDCLINFIEWEAFAGLHKLERLVLTGNSFPIVGGDMFHDLLSLQQLIIANNDIERIEKSAFWYVRNRLRHLDLRNNKLQCLPVENISNLKNLERIDITGNPWKCVCRDNLARFLTANDIAFEIRGGCDVTISYPTSNPKWQHRPEIGTIHWGTLQESIGYMNRTIYRPTPVPPTIEVYTQKPTYSKEPTGTCLSNDNSEQYYTCSGLTSLSPLDMLPRSVHTIKIVRSKITTINYGVLSRFDGYLKVLEFYDCGIEKIDRHAFHGLINLDRLILRSNHLQSISADELDGITRLRYLDLSRNNIVRITNGVFDVLPYLASLDISENLMNCIGVEQMAKQMPHLRWLAVSNNPWSCLCGVKLARFLEERRIPYDSGSLIDRSEECYEVTGFPSRQPHTTSRPTTVTYAPPTIEPPFPEANYTDLGNCVSTAEEFGKRYRCTGSSVYLFKNLPSDIVALELEECHIQNLPANVFANLQNLREITIRNCGLRLIQPDAFAHLHHLRRLTIQDNPLLLIGASWFSLEKLEVLDLRGNSIKYIEPGSFRNLNNLVYLNLEGNDLKCIFTSDLNDMKNIQTIEFSGNPLKWRCRTELEQFLETRRINFVKVETSCEGKKLVRNLLLQKNDFDDCKNTSGANKIKDNFLISVTILCVFHLMFF